MVPVNCGLSLYIVEIMGNSVESQISKEGTKDMFARAIYSEKTWDVPAAAVSLGCV